ncbi:nucleotide exchange factor GrpE [Permianibacter aggregans]|uniref:Protein GrpE n=1 Tax=Permianibacter aggregans TaxID=1510150 RepID=A0A4R6UJ42_9GAMM|nr:nucleotide exchange factor GrpE [Permianibacter aggregans]QGX40635.1 nucleotide exchange factor GrpE [Permianibacter aggregans]TDQ46502.1 molecular chaperone GrpE [Permianibacter aggregans]
MSTEQPTPDTEGVAPADNDNFNENSDLSEDVAKLKADLASAEEKAKQNWDLVLRTKADAENLVRRAERNAENSAKFAVERLCGELLEVLDGLDQGLQLNLESDEAKKVAEGMELTQRKLLSVLEKFGVKAIEAQGQPFNPDLHEAMVAQENADVAPDTVLMVLQKGYTLHGRLLRPARVIVSRGPVQKIDENA